MYVYFGIIILFGALFIISSVQPSSAQNDMIDSILTHTTHNNYFLSIMSPLKQLDNGVSPQDITCKESLHLVLKYDDMPACVSESSISKLVDRGWITIVVVASPLEPPSNTNQTNMDPQKHMDEQYSYTDITTSNNQFMLDFYSKTGVGKNENAFFSPFSIMSAFSILYEGAKGETADEIAQTFYLPTDDAVRRDSFKTLQEYLNSNSSGVEQRNANSLWINKSITIKPDYINVAQQYYDALVSNVEFPKDESVIDSWVEEKTNNKIKDLVKDKTGKDTAMVIVNAIYFNGSWQIQFESENTRDKDFKIDATNTVTVPMMNAHSYFDHTYMDGTDIISLPYKNNTASMIILLPRDDSDEGMTLLEQNISIEKLNEWNDNLRSTDIILYLPKFKIEKTYELSNIMKDMGIHQAFDKKKSNLTGIFDSGVPWDRLYVSDAIHKSFVDVNEEGTEAAAATAIVVSRTTSAPPQPPPPLIINVDHPFIFFIQDNETGIITFMGKIVDPTK